MSIGSTQGTRARRRNATSSSPRNTRKRAGSLPSRSSRAISSSIASTSSGLGRRSPVRRASDCRIVRTMSSRDGEPSVVMPARAGAVVSAATTWLLTKSGSSKSSKNRSRNSSRVRTKRNPSCPSPPPCPSPAPPPPPWPPGGRSSRSPVENSLFPDSTSCRSPAVKTEWNDGSCSTSAGMVTASPCPTSRSVPLSTAARAALATASLARVSSRCRFSRFFPCGLGRLSIMSNEPLRPIA